MIATNQWSTNTSTSTYQGNASQQASNPLQTHPILYNGVNPNYPGLRLVHANPPIFCVENFVTEAECKFLIQAASDSFMPSPVVGKGSGEISATRTSSTCYLAREDVPDLMRKISALTGKPMEHCELPQVGRYEASQYYFQHFDAFNLDEEDGRRFASNGGQRTVTVLLYLNTVERGGATSFPGLQLQVQPRQGTALVFFPATVQGSLDRQALHAALPAVDTKFVSQIWIRQSSYFGQASKRLSNIMGRPFGGASNNGHEGVREQQLEQHLLKQPVPPFAIYPDPNQQPTPVYPNASIDASGVSTPSSNMHSHHDVDMM
eukprot:Nitzschia sp. Nitz4//scaffold163_size50693//37346//38395//NITZ4_006993-RA/size50693-snap-gene-0.61-mRNA-1//1//CDS//3329538046//2182//frame0